MEGHAHDQEVQHGIAVKAAEDTTLAGTITDLAADV